LIPVDNHLHTKLCGHASGEIEEYIDAAERKGIREVGFSDHLPLYWLPPGKKIMNYAMDENDLPRYAERVRQVGSNSPVSVKLGIEADFVPGYEKTLENILSPYPFDFVMGSVHFIDGWGFDNPDEMGEYARRDIDEVYERYFTLLRQAALSGYFDIMAHPDLVKKFGFRPVRDLSSLYEDTARVFKQAGVCVEVNTAGLRYPAREIYPSARLLEVFFRYGLPVSIGSDAHHPRQVGNGLEEAVGLVKKIGYREIATFTGRKIKFVKIY